MKTNAKSENILKIVSISVLTAIFVILIFLLFLNETTINFSINGADEIFANSFQVYYFDVGQANASLIIFPQKSAMLIDTGSSASQDSFLTDLEYVLHKNKIEQIDYLFLTHSDEDHVGGAVSLLEKFQVNRIFRPKILSSKSIYDKERSGMIEVDSNVYEKTIDAVYNEPNCQVEFVENKTLFVFDVQIDVWAAEKNDVEIVNYYSPFIRVSYAGKNFLFTGDATAKRENEFVQRYQSLGESFEIDFLLVSHHGSNESTTTEFLQTIKPEIAVISSGDDLHPTKDVLSRLQEAKVKKIYQTKTMGNVMIGMKDSGAYLCCCESFKIDVAFIIVLISIFFFVMLKFLCEKSTINKVNIKKFFV